MKFLKFFSRLISEVAEVLMLDDWLLCQCTKGHHLITAEEFFHWLKGIYRRCNFFVHSI